MEVADNCPALQGDAAQRAEQALSWRRAPEAFDRDRARAEFDDLMR